MLFLFKIVYLKDSWKLLIRNKLLKLTKTLITFETIFLINIFDSLYDILSRTEDVFNMSFIMQNDICVDWYKLQLHLNVSSIQYGNLNRTIQSPHKLGFLLTLKIIFVISNLLKIFQKQIHKIMNMIYFVYDNIIIKYLFLQ